MTPMEVIDQIDTLGNSKPTVESLEELKVLVATHARALVADARELAHIKEAGGLTPEHRQSIEDDITLSKATGDFVGAEALSVALSLIDHQASELERLRGGWQTM